MVRAFRSYWFATLGAIAVAVFLLVWMNRGVMIRTVEQVAESSNVAMSQMALHPIRADLAAYLRDVAALPPREVARVPLPVPVAHAIDELMHSSRVQKVKIYNRAGVVAFSTEPWQVGRQQESNPRFLAAMEGRVAVKLVYRDVFTAFNAFASEEQNANLVQSYIPVRERPSGPVAGVFEVYQDVDALVHQAEQMQMRVLLASMTILLVLYAALLIVMRRSRRLIESQAGIIREKTAMLEAVSRDSLRREEHARKRLATDLHEGLAQTLSAVKLAVEASGHARARPGEREARLRSIIPDLQHAIGQVRAIVMELRPPSLDELGLLHTIDSLMIEFGDTHPQVRLDSSIQAQERDIPPPLKIVVYRVLEAALRAVGARPTVTRVSVSLEASREVRVEVRDDAGPMDSAANREAAEAIAEIHQRAVMSGGKVAALGGDDGLSIRVAWKS